jgi:hypothetical protein
VHPNIAFANYWDGGVVVFITPEGMISFGVNQRSSGNTGGQLFQVMSDKYYNDNQNHHVVATWSATNGQVLYIDGMLVA